MNEFTATIGNKKKTIIIEPNSIVKVNGKNYKAELSHLNGQTYLLKIDNRLIEMSASRKNYGKFIVTIEGHTFDILIRSALEEKAAEILEQSASHHHKMEIKAPMPGMILKVKKKAGDEVKQSESIMILEAMKMENDLRSPYSGKIKEIFVTEGSAVEKGAILFLIE
jgi:biotin carboxyl carrier protein